MLSRVRREAAKGYERLLRWELSGTPDHVAVIQDGNRRYADKQGSEASDGHRAGAQTTEQLLDWCADLDIQEVTLYAFSTENFERPPDEQEALFDLITEKLYEFADADRIHDGNVRIRAIGDTQRLPDRLREAIRYAEDRTHEYDELHLNIALAYGGRAELLGAARDVAREVAAGDLDPADIEVETVDAYLYEGPVRDVDLIVRTAGEERTSNFLPWHANGNEAAVCFCTPYWPEFRKIDFLRAIRTYEHREDSWRTARARRALALVRAMGSAELDDARSILQRFRDHLPSSEQDVLNESTNGTDVDVEPEPAAD